MGEYRGPASCAAFSRYFLARLGSVSEELSWRSYVADALREAPSGRYPSLRWAETIKPAHADGRSGDEIAADVIKKLGLEVTA